MTHQNLVPPSQRLINLSTYNGKLYYMMKINDLKPKDDYSFKTCSSPFRKDLHPSFSICCDRKTNKWFHNDFGDPSVAGDVFTFAARLYRLNPTTQFNEVIERMYDDIGFKEMDQDKLFRLLNGFDGTTGAKYFKIKIPNIKYETSGYSEYEEVVEVEDKHNLIIKIEEKHLSKFEKKFLLGTGIDVQLMGKYETYFISGYLFYYENGKTGIKHKPKTEIWIAYVFNGCCKIYCPLPKKFWYIGKKKGNHIFGTPKLHPQFNNLTTVFLAAGEKDTLMLLSRGYYAMCLNSETQKLDKNEVQSWYTDQKYKVIVVYDIDTTGIEQAKKLHLEFGLPYITLPNWIKEKGGKDVTDFFCYGGTVKEFDDLVLELQKETIEQQPLPNRLAIRTAEQRLFDAKNMPDILPHADVLFQSNELCIFFGDTGKGKSIFAVGLAEAISRGESFLGLENKCEPLKVLYYDFELSDKQFYKRYNNQYDVPYSFSPNFFIDNIDLSDYDPSIKRNGFDEFLMQKISSNLKEIDAKVLIIDNITFLTTFSAEDGQVAMNVMKHLKELKNESGISILVLAHTPKRFGNNGIALNDLAGSKHLSNFADSVTALGVSKKDSNLRYLIQVKPSRTAEIKYDAENIILCEIQKIDSLLTLVFKGFDSESNHLNGNSPEVEQEQINEAKELYAQGKTIRQIADILKTVSKSTVGRWLKDNNEIKN